MRFMLLLLVLFAGCASRSDQIGDTTDLIARRKSPKPKPAPSPPPTPPRPPPKIPCDPKDCREASAGTTPTS